jgi:hypothetical protein
MSNVLKVFIVLSVLMSSTSWSQVLITNQAELESFSRFSKNNLILVRGGIFKTKMYPFELGKPISPHYRVSNQIHRLYREENRCFEVIYTEGVTWVYPSACFDVGSYFTLEGHPGFKMITLSQLIQKGFGSFTAKDLNQIWKLKGFVHNYRDIDDVPGPHPFQEFNVNLKWNENLNLSEKAFVITQKVSLSIGALGIQSSKEIPFQQVIELKASDYLFYDGGENVILMKNFIPRPFLPNWGVLNTAWENEIKTLEKNSTSSPVCARDDLYNPQPEDCNYQITKINYFLQGKDAMLFKINFKNKLIEPLN